MPFFQFIGIAVVAWAGVGLIAGLAFVGTRPAMFFSAGFQWGAMARTVLFAALFWPSALRQVLVGDREDERRDERDRENRSRIALRMYRHELRRGAWYRDVLGVRRKWLLDHGGRPYDPQWIGPEAHRVREEEFACRDGTWEDGPCPVCGAPEKGASACGMVATEFVGVPQYTPPARPMRHAPREGFVLAVSNDDLGKTFIDRERDRFHEVAFRETAPGRGVWVGRDGVEVDGLHGWWPLPRMDETQSSDGLEEPARWLGGTPPEPYDGRKAWDARLGRGEPAAG